MFSVEEGGYALRPGPAMMLSAIIARRGTVADGRRPTRREREGTADFRRQPLGAGDLKRLFRWSYDEIQSWGETLAMDHPCPACGLAHPLVTYVGAERDGKPPGTRARPTRAGRAIPSKNYDLVRCGDMPGRPIVAKPKRAKTGGAAPLDPDVEQLGLGLAPGVRSPRTIGHSPIVDAGTALAAIDASCDDLTLRVTAIRAITMLRRVALSDDEVLLLAQAAATADVVDGAVIDRMIAGVVARRAEVGRGLTSAEVVDEAEIALMSVASDDDADGDHIAGIGESPIPTADHDLGRPAVAAIGDSPMVPADWELRALAEAVAGQTDRPLPSSDEIVGYLAEFRARCLEEAAGDLEQSRRLLAGILTHSRVVGREPFPRPKSVVAYIRSGIAEGWIFKAAADDRAGPARTLFKRLGPARKEQIRAVLAAAASDGPQSSSWDVLRLRLKPLGVYTRDMARVACEHFAITTLPI
jgi:hypothetical protein